MKRPVTLNLDERLIALLDAEAKKHSNDYARCSRSAIANEYLARAAQQSAPKRAG